MNGTSKVIGFIPEVSYCQESLVTVVKIVNFISKEGLVPVQDRNETEGISLIYFNCQKRRYKL